MTKRFFIALFAACALLAVGCDEKDGPGTTSDEPATQSDFVGKWGWGENVAFELKADGTYTEGSNSGTWAYADGKITVTSTGEEDMTTDVILTGGKAWLVFVSEFGEGNYKMRNFSSYRKIGATVNSAALTDGRWDSPHNGYAPKEYAKDTDYGICMVVKGKTVDLYVPVWGLHVQGEFTITDGKLHIDTDRDHVWKATYWTIDGDYGSIGFNAAGCPDPDYEKTWDDSYGSINAETFEPQAPYHWYTINEILAMGEEPKPGDHDYEAHQFEFKYMVYEYGENEYSIALELCDLDFCVAADGKNAYSNGPARSPWFYKR